MGGLWQGPHYTLHPCVSQALRLGLGHHAAALGPTGGECGEGAALERGGGHPVVERSGGARATRTEGGQRAALATQATQAEADLLGGTARQVPVEVGDLWEGRGRRRVWMGGELSRDLWWVMS